MVHISFGFILNISNIIYHTWILWDRERETELLSYGFFGSVHLCKMFLKKHGPPFVHSAQGGPQPVISMVLSYNPSKRPKRNGNWAFNKPYSVGAPFHSIYSRVIPGTPNSGTIPISLRIFMGVVWEYYGYLEDHPS